MLDNLKDFHIVLASNSPRRRELLAGLDIDFDVRVLPGIDESYPADLPVHETPLYIATAKAEANRQAMNDGEIVEEGSPEDIFENPRSERLKAFLKSIIRS